MHISAATALKPTDTWNPPALTPRRRHLRVVRESVITSKEDDEGAKLFEGLTRCVVEVLAGRRSANSLAWSLSPAVLDALRSAAASAPLDGCELRTLRCQPLGGETIEIAAVVSGRNRSRAMTLRVARRRGRWRCVSVGVL